VSVPARHSGFGVAVVSVGVLPGALSDEGEGASGAGKGVMAKEVVQARKRACFRIVSQGRHTKAERLRLG